MRLGTDLLCLLKRIELARWIARMRVPKIVKE